MLKNLIGQNLDNFAIWPLSGLIDAGSDESQSLEGRQAYALLYSGIAKAKPLKHKRRYAR